MLYVDSQDFKIEYPDKVEITMKTLVELDFPDDEIDDRIQKHLVDHYGFDPMKTFYREYLPNWQTFLFWQ